MIFADVKGLTIPQGAVKEISCNNLLLWKSGYKNWVRYSTESDGKTIYNNGLGYKDGCRVRSGGGEGETTYGSCTGFIPVKGGDIVRFSGWDASVAQNENAINVSNSSFENIGQTAGKGAYGIFASGYSAYTRASMVEEKTGVWKWTVPPAASGVAYIRVSAFDNSAVNNKLGSKMIITINEEISE